MIVILIEGPSLKEDKHQLERGAASLEAKEKAEEKYLIETRTCSLDEKGSLVCRRMEELHEVKTSCGT